MKKFIGLVVVLCILLCTLTVAANEPPHDNITWTIENGTLIVKGLGAMADYKTQSEMPWYDLRNDIYEIVVEDGITHIGNMAFYGIKNVKKATIADSVKTVGMYAFSYTEGTITNLENPGAPFQITLQSDSEVVNKGDTFTLTVTLNGDFKDVCAVQTAIVFDKSLISIDKNNCLDENWLQTLDDTNIGYISSPLTGIIANNLNIAYVSLNGAYIDKNCPLYNTGKTDVVIAKINLKALGDIKDTDTSVLMLKNSIVSRLVDGKVMSETVGENQLTVCTRLPIKELVIVTNSAPVKNYAKNAGILTKDKDPSFVGKFDDEITVIANGKTVVFDTTPHINENGNVMIPLRAVLEQMNVSVIWDNSTKTIVMASNTGFCATQLGERNVFKTNSKVELVEPSVAKEERTLVSIDFFSKAFGYDVVWDKDTRTVTIK